MTSSSCGGAISPKTPQYLCTHTALLGQGRGGGRLSNESPISTSRGQEVAPQIPSCCQIRNNLDLQTKCNYRKMTSEQNKHLLHFNAKRLLLGNSSNPFHGNAIFGYPLRPCHHAIFILCMAKTPKRCAIWVVVCFFFGGGGMEGQRNLTWWEPEFCKALRKPSNQQQDFGLSSTHTAHTQHATTPAKAAQTRRK